MPGSSLNWGQAAGGTVANDPLPRSTPVAQGSVTGAFLGRVRRYYLLMFVLLAAVGVMMAIALTQGTYDIALGRLMRIIAGSVFDPADIVIWKIRLPRIVSAIMAGWGLSLSGLGIQTLLRNPLGSPFTLGISHGAAFGASLAILLIGPRIILVTLSAFAGAMCSTIVIMLLAGFKRLSPESIILAGVALTSLFMSGTVLVQYLASDTQLAMVVFWTFGDVARAGWTEIGILALVVAAVTVYLMVRRWDLNALAAGEEAARGLGVNVNRLRLAGMLAVVLMAALATAFHGVIAFVGLIAPHIAKRLVGADHGLLIPFSAILGALLLLVADTLGRVLFGSGALPVGIITSFMGAPMFLLLLARGKS